MAKAPAARKNEPLTPNRERPDEPQPYKATTDELLEFYKQMLLIRRFEEKAGQLYGLGLIGGFLPSLHRPGSRGGRICNRRLTEKDSVITGYRDHGHMLLCGIPPQGCDGRAHGACQAGISKRQGWLDAHVQRRA